MESVLTAVSGEVRAAGLGSPCCTPAVRTNLLCPCKWGYYTYLFHTWVNEL